MNTLELIKNGEKILDENFLGVFPKNKLPNLKSKRKFSLIMNLDSSNLPGTHWIAVVGRSNEAYIFDPLALLPQPLLLVNWLSRYYNNWTFNLRQIQTMYSNECGSFYLHYIFNAINLENILLRNIIDLIYPVTKNFNDYNYTIKKFKNMFV